MSKKDKALNKAKWSVKKARRRNPIKIERNQSGVIINLEETSFDPTKEEHSNRVYLVTVDGQSTRVKEVEKDGDDMILSYSDKHCCITSKPLLIEDNQFYFTKDGFVGTMALNEDTLLDADVYDPSEDIYERYIPVTDVEWEKNDDIDLTEISTVERGGKDFYKIETEEEGDIAMLNGSKKTLAEVHKAKILRKLLKPSTADRTKLLMALGSGVAGGYMLYPRLQ